MIKIISGPLKSETIWKPVDEIVYNGEPSYVIFMDLGFCEIKFKVAKKDTVEA